MVHILHCNGWWAPSRWMGAPRDPTAIVPFGPLPIRAPKRHDGRRIADRRDPTAPDDPAPSNGGRCVPAPHPPRGETPRWPSI